MHDVRANDLFRSKDIRGGRFVCPKKTEMPTDPVYSLTHPFSIVPNQGMCADHLLSVGTRHSREPTTVDLAKERPAPRAGTSGACGLLDPGPAALSSSPTRRCTLAVAIALGSATMTCSCPGTVAPDSFIWNFKFILY